MDPNVALVLLDNVFTTSRCGGCFRSSFVFHMALLASIRANALCNEGGYRDFMAICSVAASFIRGDISCSS
jgi:hypothetical protein